MSGKNKTINAEVKAKEGEPIERLLKRFTRAVKKSGVMEEVYRRRYYEKPSDTKNRVKARRKKLESYSRQNNEEK